MVSLLLHETAHQLKLFSRRPAAVFFVILMPLILLVPSFTEIFGNEEIVGQGIHPTAQFYTPTLAVFGAVMGSYTYLAIATATTAILAC